MGLTGTDLATWGGTSSGAAGGLSAAGGGSWWSNPQLWGALLGGVGSYLDADSRRGGSSSSTDMTTTTSRSPWGPSEQYRLDAMARANALLGGGGGGGGGARYRAPRQDWSGSRELADAARASALGGDPLVDFGRNYLQNSLSDQYGGSALMGRTFNAAENLQNEDLNNFVRAMMGEWGGGGNSADAARARQAAFVSAGGAGGGGGGAGLIGMDRYIREMLDSEYDSQNPELNALLDIANRRATDAYRQGLAGLSAAGETSGMYGSSDYQLADAQAASGFATALTDAETGLRFQDYNRWRNEIMQAMGLGTQYDLGMADVNARRDATAASAASAAQANATQRELGNRGLLLNAFGLQNDLSGMGLGMMGEMAGLDVNNRQFMLGAIPAYHDIGMSDLERAFGMNFGLEGGINQQNAANARAAFESDRWNADSGWRNLGRFMDIINSASGDYGGSTTHQVGTSSQQGQDPNAWLAAIQGGLAGAQAGRYLGGQWA